MKKTLKQSFGFCLAAAILAACGPASTSGEGAKDSAKAEQDNSPAMTLVWEDLMPSGEEALLAELYSEFYEDVETQVRQQMTLAEAARAENMTVTEMIAEGSADDTMEQIGTFNVVESLDGVKVRMPGYIVPLDFSAKSEHGEFLLVPYFGACLHTPPPPPNQIVFVKANPAARIPSIDEPVWLEGTLSTGKFTSDLGNSAYELDLSKLEPYDY